MKRIKNLLNVSFLSLLITGFLISCGGGDEKSNEGTSSAYDGSYNGIVKIGSVQIGTFSLTISEGSVVGFFEDGFEVTQFTSTVNASGVIVVTISYPDDYVITGNLTVSGTSIVGTWSDNEGETGTVTGTTETTDYDGTYTGTASAEGFEIGSFTVTILNGQINGSYTEDGESTSVNGFVSNAGNISFNIAFSDGVIASITGAVSGSTMSGTFSNTEGMSGTFTGTKQ